MKKNKYLKWQILFILLMTVWRTGSFAGTTFTNHPQGELWRLLEQGSVNEAQSLEQRLTQIMMTAPMDALATVERGMSESYFVKLPHNIYAFAKASDPKHSNSQAHELAAYRLDRLLKVHMTSLTVIREVEGQRYSIQLFYPSFLDRSLGETQMRSDMLLRMPDLEIFDFIMGNDDRILVNEHNALIGKDGRVVAYDHGRAFTQDVNMPGLSKMTLEFREAVEKVSRAEIVSILQGVLEDGVIDKVWQRISSVQTGLKKLKSEARPYFAVATKWKAKFEYVIPIEMKEKNFFDALSVRHQLIKASGGVVDSEMAEVLRAGKAQKMARVISIVALQNWPYYNAEVKTKLLPLIWSDWFVEDVRNRRQIVAEISELSPSRGRLLLDMIEAGAREGFYPIAKPLILSSTKSSLAPRCSAIFGG